MVRGELADTHARLTHALLALRQPPPPPRSPPTVGDVGRSSNGRAAVADAFVDNGRLHEENDDNGSAGAAGGDECGGDEYDGEYDDDDGGERAVAMSTNSSRESLFSPASWSRA